MTTIPYVLFAARHEVPANQGPIWASFDFKTHEPVPYQEGEVCNLDEVCGTLFDGGQVHIIVTGLTPALTHFIALAMRESRGAGKLVLLHHDRDTNSYWEQVMWDHRFDAYPADEGDSDADGECYAVAAFEEDGHTYHVDERQRVILQDMNRPEKFNIPGQCWDQITQETALEMLGEYDDQTGWWYVNETDLPRIRD